MQDSEDSALQAAIIANLLGFCRYLRRLGLVVGSSQVANFLRALEEIDVTDRRDFYFTAEATLVNQGADRDTFRQAFARYWAGEGHRAQPKQGGLDLRTGETGNKQVVMRAAAGSVEEGGAERGTYSSLEVLRQKDFAELTEEEEAQMRELVANLAWNLEERRSRRYRRGQGARPDFRRSVGLNLRHGGEWLRWAYKGRKRRPRSLVLLADVSGSMEPYSRMVLSFCYGLAKGLRSDVEAFVFGTRLTRITRALNQRTVGEAMDRVAEAVPDWSGGTRIGESLRSFNLNWARRVLAREAVVVVISDGWDRGDPMALAREVARVSRQASRLIWLNPLLGQAGYRPATRGMRAALPHLDHFLPAHNLASLQDLAERLEGVRARGRGWVRRPDTSLPTDALEGRSL